MQKSKVAAQLLISVYTILADRVHPKSTTNVNGVDKARHALMLRQHGATACTELLEAYYNIGVFPVDFVCKSMLSRATGEPTQTYKQMINCE